MWCCPHCGLAAAFPNPDRPWTVDWNCERCRQSIPRRAGIPCLAPELADSAAGFDPNLFQRLVGFEESNFWFVNRARLIVRLLEKHFPDCRNFLEIGCGTGSVLLALRKSFPNLTLTGSELQLRGLALPLRASLRT